MIPRIALPLVFLIAGAQSVMAEPVALRDAVRQALAYDPSITQAEAGAAGSAAGVRSAKARRSVQAGVEAQLGASQTDFTQNTVSQMPRQVALQAELPLYTSGALKAGEDAARQRALAADRMLEGTREATVLATIEAYAQAGLAQKLVEVAEARAQTFSLRNREASASLEQGVVTRTDVSLTEARMASAEAQLARTQALLAGAQARLERLTGIAGMEAVETELNLRAKIAPSQGEAVARVLQRSPALAAARAGKGEADARLREVQGSFGPKVSLRARASAGEDMYFFFEDQITDVGAFLRVEVPMFTSGLRAASRSEAEAARNAAIAGERAAQLGVIEIVSGLWAEIDAQRAGLDAARRAEAAATLAAEGAQKEYEAGIRTLVEALDAETNFRNVQAERYQAETALLIAETRLLAMSRDLEAALLE